jgi:hypothetical protein
MRRSASVILQVEAERLGERSDLHRPSGAKVVLRVGVNHVAAAGEHEGGFAFDAAHVLANEERRAQTFAQALVSFWGNSGISIRVLEPKEPRVIAGATDCQRVHPGAQLTGGIKHQREAIADSAAHGLYRRDFTAHVPIVPAMNLEASKALCAAGCGVVSESFG